MFQLFIIFLGVSGGIAVRNDPEIDIDNINICDNLKGI